MDFAVGDTAGWNDSQINMDLGDDQWHLLNLTFSVGKVSAYVDGVFIQSTQSQGNYRPTNAPLEIGHWWSPTFQSRMFIGIIDEVRIYNRALTHAEIQTLYNATK